MANTITVKGRLTGPTTVELFEPVNSPLEGEFVEVVLRTQAAPGSVLKLLEHLKSLPPGTRTREDIDAQIREERDSWE
jgi:hypothetical protein